MRHFGSILLSISLLFLLPGCVKKTSSSEKTTIWIYTSLYQSVIDQIDPIIKKEIPDIEVKWFAAGSEKVLTKVNAELAAGQLKADLIMTSDPFWYEQLRNNGLLLPYVSPLAKDIPESLKDSNGFWTTVRIPVMVIAYNKDVFGDKEKPKSFKELTKEKWKGKIALGSPLESGTNFTTVANLSMKYGWDYYKALRKNEAFSSGGNSTVRMKIESKEYPVGVILLENILAAKRSGSPMTEIYPEDGVVMVPSPIAIFKRTSNADAAKKLYDFMLSQKGQEAIIAGDMYSPLPNFKAPAGAKPFSEVFAKAFIFNQNFVDEVLKTHNEIKNNYSKIMFE